nr:EOG090X0FJX [Eurycercus lamellatus]
MNPGDFELETRLRSLSVERDENSESRDNQFAELIAHCADVEPRGTENEDAVNVESKENDLPTSLIVTNLPQSLFTNQQMKTEFEGLFKTFDPSAAFHYLRSFRRARVDFGSHAMAAKARAHLHHTPFGDNIDGSIMNCFYGQPPLRLSKTADRQFLQIPPPVRQFLISPPASPPVDWAPGPETQPVVNFDLLSAIASLGPGDKHELLPAEDNKPGIVVHICADVDGSRVNRQHMNIAQTPCPKRN